MQQYVHASTKDLDVQNLDSAVSRVFDSLYPNPLLASPTIVIGLVFAQTTDLVVEHKLGRVPKGYILISSSGPAMLYTSSTKNNTPKASIILQTSAAITASILFF